MKKILVALTVMAIMLSLPAGSYAAVKRKTPTPKKKTTTLKAKAKTVTLPIGVSIKSKKGKKAIIVTFSNLKGILAINYILSYDTNGSTEGAMGTIKPKGKNITRELLLGTCSSGVCRYHQGAKNISFEVSVTTKKGTTTRTFPVKL